MKIMFLNGAMAGQTVDLLPSGTTIGRESNNVIQLPMGGVSRYHATIERDSSGRWLIRDLGSTNGTLVDDVPVDGAALLVGGSVVTIGDQLLRCLDSDAAGGAARPSAPVPPPSAPVPPPSAPVPPPAAPVPPSPAPTPASSAPASSDPGRSSVFFFRPQNAAPPSPSGTAPVPGRKDAPAPAPTGSPSSPTIPEVPLFGKKPSGEAPANRPKKLLGNIIFALIVILAAIIGLWLFLVLNESSRTPANPEPAKKKVVNPFVLYYEKEAISGKSVFRFVLQIENGLLEVTLDEPQNKRHYYERFTEPIPQNLIESLKKQISDSGFMDLQQEKIAGTSQNNRQHRRIMVGFDNKFCDVKVTNDVSQTFNSVETIISETVLDEFDLGVVSQSVDQILEDAQRFLFEAESEFATIDTTPSNLPKAISHYKLAVRRYQLFEPKPESWTIARDGLAKAEAKLDEIYQGGVKNIKLFYELREYEKAIAECNRLLEIFPPDSATYQNLRENKIKIENKMSVRSN